MPIGLWTSGRLEILLFEPERAEGILAATTEHFAAMAGALAAAGASCIAIPLMLCNPKLLPPAVISRSIVPCLERAFARGGEYRRLRREGVFFLLPEWCARWREVFGERLGFVTAESARLFMQEMHRRIAYLDTGVTPVPTEKLAEIGYYFGLPVDVVAVSPGRLADAVFRALEGGGE